MQREAKQPRAPRRRVVGGTYYYEWLAILSCGHEIPAEGIRRWRKHTRRTCRECAGEGGR